MGKFKIVAAPINGLYVIEPTIYMDDRGYFMEVFNQNDMQIAGLDKAFVQENQSMSTKGVLRGLHFQRQYPQGKLVRAIRGTVFDVAVDLCPDSETFGKWFGIILSDQNKKQFYISEWFAHGVLALSDVAEITYKCTEFYHPEDEGGIAWNDPTVGIEWPGVVGHYSGSASVGGYMLDGIIPLTLSEKDQLWSDFRKEFPFY